MMMHYYKVVVLQIEIYETTIADERHFGTEQEAQAFAKEVSENMVAVIIAI